MADFFKDVLYPKLKGVEGGYVNNPKDRGGETNHGIIASVARENGYAGPMRSMTEAQAFDIYKSQYYIRAGIHLIAPISEAIAAELFDTGVNMGPGTAGRILQRCLNVLNREGKDYPDIGVDGAVGPATARALASFLKVRGKEGEHYLLVLMNCLQGARYIDLAEHSPSQEEFMNGWARTRLL